MASAAAVEAAPRTATFTSVNAALAKVAANAYRRAFGWLDATSVQRDTEELVIAMGRDVRERMHRVLTSGDAAV
jgi:hypothetical protein